jgi:hypothetical protein
VRSETLPDGIAMATCWPARQRWSPTPSPRVIACFAGAPVDSQAGRGLVCVRQMIDAGQKKVTIAALALAAQITGLTVGVYARDHGQYEDVPQHIRDWFKALKNPQNGRSCCDLSDCARTEARTEGNQWQARAPDGSWITIPADAVVHNQGNPTGEPILCADAPTEKGWRVLCFVPGPGG